MKHTNRKSNRRLPATRQTRQILELLATHPTGLTVFEIAARVRGSIPVVVRTLAAMQQRRWLRTAAATRQSALRSVTTG